MTQIVTLTLNPAVDINCTVDHVIAEQKLRCDRPHYHPGGGGINVARVIHELGGKSAAFWTSGGAIGDLLQQLLNDENIEHHPIPIRALTRENFIVYESSSGRQYRFGMPGPTLTNEEVQNCLDELRTVDPSPDYLVLSGSLPNGTDEKFYARLADAMSSDCRVVLDTSGSALKFALESAMYLIKPNVRELGQLVGRKLDNDAQIREASRSLVDECSVQCVVTSLGSGGAILTMADKQWHFRAPTVDVRSKVGAGDSMVAGIVFALAQGKSIEDAIRFGIAAGTAAVMTAGTELCRRDDVERLSQDVFEVQNFKV